jgi:hypothetical protein
MLELNSFIKVFTVYVTDFGLKCVERCIPECNIETPLERAFKIHGQKPTKKKNIQYPRRYGNNSTFALYFKRFTVDPMFCSSLRRK